jgi:hypothetical protein
MDGNVTGRRWPWFVAWAVSGAGFVLCLSALALAAFPLAILMVLMFRRRSRGRERLGLLAGAGIAVAFFGTLHTNYRACTAAPRVGRIAYSCGGVDGPRWLIAGLAATIASAVLYRYMGQRSNAAGMASAAPTAS